ncbi:MAG TPA: FAD-dependent oxidoreductase [Flexivirga sp.]|uniref:NAD(P)/FAD-dependent oxidoreductase n=1 Tax=Flexivirga sp. TaxID=1962927 RepID=UPI002BC33860|nr:FAD-dependent oxidoreductase [Flexivirga sp.]HWC23462.1 FAD-dependent oxidoreductase [Flexivirga sp.]
MPDFDKVVIVGGGLAGAKTAEALRERGFTGGITLFAAESELPYERPPLSKGYLADAGTFDKAVVHPRSWYDDERIDLQLGTRVTAIDPARHEVRTEAGDTNHYDKLVLATGSTPRTLPISGADAQGVLTLRTRQDADAIRESFGPGRRLVVIGGGWIGLEVAATARDADTDVTVLEAAELPLLAVLGPQLGRVFAELHRDHGVDLRLGVHVTGIQTRNGAAAGVSLTDGSVVPADAVLIGVGAAPDVELAEAAGLAIDDGVVVDAALRTSDPDIYAVGDIAAHDHPVLGRRIRVEHWATALNQPTAAAASLLGATTEFTDLPYFFSDQFDLGMEYVGHASPHDRVVVRGDLPRRKFIAFWLDGDDHVIAGLHVNTWDVIDEIRPLITGRVRVDPARLADAEVPLSSFLQVR